MSDSPAGEQSDITGSLAVCLDIHYSLLPGVLITIFVTFDVVCSLYKSQADYM